jgi:hypothetical protein
VLFVARLRMRGQRSGRHPWGWCGCILRLATSVRLWGDSSIALVFRESLGRTLPAPRLIGDGGHQGNPRITSPRRGPDGRIVRDGTTAASGKRRAITEHTIVRPTDHRILRQCRRRAEAIDHAIAGVAAPHNLELGDA